MAANVTTYTLEEWKAEGTRRFGPDHTHWKFTCPVCHHIAGVMDFEPYKDKGASPNSATAECVGRYTGAKDFMPPGAGPCNYAGYGLIRLSPVRVIHPDGHSVHCFAFADV